MPEEFKPGCARPTGGPVGEKPVQNETKSENNLKETGAMIKVGRKAPDFSAPAFFNGKFMNINLSEYLGK